MRLLKEPLSSAMHGLLSGRQGQKTKVEKKKLSPALDKYNGPIQTNTHIHLRLSMEVRPRGCSGQEMTLKSLFPACFSHRVLAPGLMEGDWFHHNHDTVVWE